MGSKNPPDSVRLWDLMEGMGRPQLRELATFTMALASLRERLGEAEDMGAIISGHITQVVYD